MVKHMPHVKSVMTPFPNSVELDITASQALEFMKKHDIRYLPATDNNRIIGVISEREIQIHLEYALTNSEGNQLTVKDIYLPDPYIVDLNEPLDNVLSVMSKKQIGSALVTRKGKLVGIFTATDACRSFSEYLKKQFPVVDDDILA